MVNMLQNLKTTNLLLLKGHLALLHKAFLMPKEGQEEERYVWSLIKRDARGRPILPREQIWSRVEHVIKSINY